MATTMYAVDATTGEPIDSIRPWSMSYGGFKSLRSDLADWAYTCPDTEGSADPLLSVDDCYDEIGPDAVALVAAWFSDSPNVAGWGFGECATLASLFSAAASIGAEIVVR